MVASLDPANILEPLAAVQEALDHALREAPLYVRRGLPPRGAASGDAEAVAADVSRRLAALPPLTKADLRTQFPRGFADKEALRTSLASGDVEVVGTSGTTADRVQVLWDRGWWDRQERAAMRLSAHVARVMKEAERDGGYREAVLTTPVCGATCHIGDLPYEQRLDGGILFLNQTPDPSRFTPRELRRMVEELERFRPHGLEADPAYLSALCRFTRREGLRLFAPAFVTLTYELTSALHLREIRRALPDTPLLALYGSTETGVLFMACDAGRLHHSQGWSHVETLPLAGKASGWRREAGRPPIARVLATTVGRRWMPLVRYDIGDVVTLGAGAPCRCGLRGATLGRVEGRGADLLGREDGPIVTPAEVDDALSAVPGLAAYQLAQDGADTYTLRYVPNEEAGDAAPEAASGAASLAERLLAAVRGLLEPSARLSLSRETAILPEPSGKYRLARRFAPLPVSALFPVAPGAPGLA